MTPCLAHAGPLSDEGWPCPRPSSPPPRCCCSPWGAAAARGLGPEQTTRHSVPIQDMATHFQNYKRSRHGQAVLRIRDVYPGFRILIFTHSGSRIQKQQQKRGVKKICCQTFFCSHKFLKIENYFIF